ncbi:MAG: MFS transporter [Alphaproteobacteria bacterium]|nr:MAG: MFS transporter [Alphaproteobacteria bacterium]
MSSPSLAWTRAVLTPGAVVFALLFALDSMARALLGTVVPLLALRVLGNARDVSLLFSVIGWVGVALSLFIPAIVRRYRPRWVYTIGAGLLVVAPFLLALDSLFGLAGGMLARVFAAACLLNALNLYIMAYIRKRDLARSEPLRTFFSAFAWATGPFLGVYLYNDVSPWATYLLSAGCALLLIAYFWRLRMEYGPALPADEPARTSPVANIRRYVAQPRLRLAWILNFGRETWWVMFFIYGPLYMVTHGMSETAGALLVSCGTAMLFTTPAMGWLGRRIGLRRFLMGGFLWVAAATFAAALLVDRPGLTAAALLAAAVGSVALDSVCMVPFMRAVRGRERPEMTMVFSMYRDVAGLVPPAVFAALLSFLDLWSVFAAAAAFLAVCAWLARWIPRGM